MAYDAIEKLLVSAGQSKLGVCLPEKPPPAPIGELMNPHKVDVGRWAAGMSVVCRVLSIFVGGGKPGPDIPGNACPPEMLNQALKPMLKNTLPENAWFVMKLTGRSAEGINFEASIFHWNGERVDRMYDVKGAKFYDFDQSGRIHDSNYI